MRPLATLTPDTAQWERASEEMLTALLTEASMSVGAQTRGLEKDLEARTRQEVRGNLWRGWKSKVFPTAGRPAYDPTGTVFVNGGKRSQGAMSYWTKPGVNRAKSGGYLAFPTPAAGVGRRGVPLSPEEWERAHGIKLRALPPDKPKVLVARMTIYSSGRAIAKRPLPRTRVANADGSVVKTRDAVIFVLIPEQRFANKFSVAPIVQRREKMLVDDFERRVALGMKKVFRG